MATEKLKDLPGYKAILKAVLQQQIQMLIEQLSEHTGEETVVLSANVIEGTMSHLGSEYGKIFLEKEQAIQSKFLGFCLKKNLLREEESKDSSVKETLPPKQKRKLTGSSENQLTRPPSKVQKLGKEDSAVPGSTSQQNFVGLFPDLSRATSNYLQKLNETVGQEVMRNDIQDGSQHDRNYPVPSSVGNDQSRSDADLNKSDLDMSIVKVDPDDDITYTTSSTEAYNSIEMAPIFADLNHSGTNNSSSRVNGSDKNQGYTKSSKETLRNRSGTLGANNTSYNGDLSAVGGQSVPRQLRMFKCDFCDKTFREKTNLRVHVRTHTGEKPFKCFLCGKDFAHSSNLKQHERGVHKLPPTIPQYKQQFYTGLSKMQELSQQAEVISIDNQMFLSHHGHSQGQGHEESFKEMGEGQNGGDEMKTVLTQDSEGNVCNDDVDFENTVGESSEEIQDNENDENLAN